MFRSDKIVITELKSLGLLLHHNRYLLFCFQVWRIEDLELKEVNPVTYGQFYGGDCYLVLYTYNRANKPQYILYMWQVRSIAFIFLSLTQYNTEIVLFYAIIHGENI